MRILVVEDDKKIAAFVVNGLKQSGFSVDHASDGDQALSHFRSVAYDAAVLDVMLPKLDGLSLLPGATALQRDSSLSRRSRP
jgi:two-component system OmpR family response regulator